MPAALIPFCSYQGKPIGEKPRDLEFSKEWHLCTQFRPAILQGQLCYTLDLSKLERNKTKSGVRNGLVLVLDTQMSVQDHTEMVRKKQVGMDFADPEDEYDSGMTKVFLHTLSPFASYQAGSYALSSLKRMVGTENFKSMPNDKKKCQNEVFEDCQARMFCDAVKTNCKCVPWALAWKCSKDRKSVSCIVK